MDLLEFTANIGLHQVGKDYLLTYQNRNFHIGKVIYEILILLKSNIPLAEKLKTIERKWNMDLEALTKLIHSCLIEKIEDKTLSIKQRRYIYFKIELIKGNSLAYITKVLQNLFVPIIFKMILASSVILTLAFFWTENSFAKMKGIGTISDLVAVYLSLIVILFFHEFGHVSASRSFGVESKSIGFGFYLVFPVLFADVSKTWVLESKKRIIINFGGVYFQLLLNALLILSYYIMSSNSKVIHVLIATNTIIILYSLNPFLRNDGYWMFSDFFEIENLMAKATRYPIEFLKRCFKKNAPLKDLFQEIRKDLPLILYSISNYLFIGLSLYYISFVYIHQINSDIMKIVHTGFDQIGNHWMVFFKAILFYFLLIYVIIRYVRFSQSQFLRFYKKSCNAKSIN